MQKTKFKSLAKWAIIAALLALPLRNYLFWMRGIVVARSTNDGYTVIVRKQPQMRYRFSPIDYLTDSGEDRSVLDFTFEVYSSGGSEVTTFHCTNPAFESWNRADIQIKWKPVPKSQPQARRFTVDFDGYSAVECRFGHSANWRRL